MHKIDISRIDLNLLVVFEALMEERHVGRASVRLSLSQSATSHALARLRALFEDPLFVRNPRGIEATARGRELAVPIAEALAQLRVVFAPKAAFDPAALRRTFTVSTHDYALATLVPALMVALRAQAPGVELRCVSVHPTRIVEALDRGELDFALGGLRRVQAARVQHTLLFRDHFVGVARQGHPRLRKGRMSLKDFAAQSHVVVSPSGETRVDVDAALVALGIERRIAMTAPSFLALPFIVEGSDLIGVLPRRLAARAAERMALSCFELPFEAEPSTCSMAALKPLMATPEMQWMRALLEAAAAQGAAD
ncbi:LysR family transcriptional regulator [Niveibacterium sp. SC-1]|uniref:LysR family transcriptional regulator n=1 Tax=Niveibacterium sp. SC-1 TaxID=3135646 RepID=UPI00311DFD0D